jgi:hypothetical protein
VSSDEPEKPRIPILEIPSVEQKAEAEEPEQEAVNVEVPEKPRKPRIPIMELPPQKQPAPSTESVEDVTQ